METIERVLLMSAGAMLGCTGALYSAPAAWFIALALFCLAFCWLIITPIDKKVTQ